jgi:hypothetical protein
LESWREIQPPETGDEQLGLQGTLPDVLFSLCLLHPLGSAKTEKEPVAGMRNLHSTLLELCYILFHSQSSHGDFCKICHPIFFI